MPKKDNSNLLKPDSAVADFLDTLLQESTEQKPLEKPLKSKPRILLMPDLVEKPPEAEVETSVNPQNQVILEDAEQIQQQAKIPEIENKEFDYQFPLQCLMFKVAGNHLSIPLINMGSVLTWSEKLTMLPGAPDWFLGILKHRELNVKVADTAKIINATKVDSYCSGSRHILVFGDDNWAITCDEIGDVVNLNKDDVKWSGQDSKGFSLGTIKQSLAVLLSPVKILNRLNEHNAKLS